MVMILFASLLAIGSILPYCYYASQMIFKLQQMADITYETDWYRWPIHLQKNIQPMIRHSQKVRTVHGYGLFRCNLEAFMKVKYQHYT